MTSNPWLPIWLSLAWTVVFAIILISHLWHIVIMSGRDRRWHSLHVLMALGMIVMFAPTGQMIVSGKAGMVVFAVVAVVVAYLLIRERAHGLSIGQLWLVNIVDLVAMVYMFALMFVRVVWLTVPLIVWLAFQAAGWATGRLWTILERGGLGGTPRPVPIPVPATRGIATAHASTARVTGQLHRERTAQDTPHNHGARLLICSTLTLMALGMAYMLIAMQFGLQTMPSMPGM